MLPFEQHWLAAGADDADDPLRRLRELLLDMLRQIAGDERLQRVVAISTQKVEYVGELDVIRQRHLHVRAQVRSASSGCCARRRRPASWPTVCSRRPPPMRCIRWSTA